MEIQLSRDLNLLLMGKTGAGKSATGNSILNRYAFTVSHESESCTETAEFESTTHSDKTLCVGDIPGLFDTRLAKDKELEEFTSILLNQVFPVVEGFNALLLVIELSKNFTEEDMNTIRLLKKVFGENVIKDHTVCVITRGDQYRKKIKRPFDEWKMDRQGFLGDIFKECNYRCVLFDNDTEDVDEKRDQVLELLCKIDEMNSSSEKYTPKIFQEAKLEREKAIAERKIPNINEENMKKLTQIKETIDKAIEHKGKDLEEILKKLKNDFEAFLSDLIDEDDPAIKETTKHVNDNFAKEVDSSKSNSNKDTFLDKAKKFISKLKRFLVKAFKVTAVFLKHGGKIMQIVPQPTVQKVGKGFETAGSFMTKLAESMKDD